MSNNNSDYERKYLDLFKLLPEVYKSDTNEALFANLFNRFLTKQEVHKVTGYAGHGNPEAIVSRQIPEPTVHRQAFQLQPIVNNKIGSIEHLASWKDFENELTRLGVDLDCTDVWNKVLQFNWVPPVDIDKLVHYRDYYWYDIDDLTTKPQYITIRSRCSTAIANVNFWKELMDANGSTFPILEVQNEDGGIIQPPLLNRLVVSGEFTTLFEPDFIFFVRDTANVDLNDSFLKVVSSEYVSGDDETIIQITTEFSDDTVGGVISLEEQYQFLLTERDCQCAGSEGWDSGQWDDNPDNPIWNTPAGTPARAGRR